LERGLEVVEPGTTKRPMRTATRRAATPHARTRSL
jgi:hypothetical protein